LNLPFSQKDVVQVVNPQAVDEKLVRSLVTAGYNAIFAFNDLMAIALVQAAGLAGVRIPQDVMVVGYDDAPVRSLIRPIIASMSMPVADIARTAGEWIAAVIVNRDSVRWQRLLPGTFSPGETMVISP
jgi:DNA-binding LacI/PurR family transcriptional regulator